jgi:multicomponent Na+:H+ antiporter subunit D
MKITLFFCAGNLAETLGIHKVSEMNGVAGACPGPWPRSRSARSA